MLDVLSRPVDHGLVSGVWYAMNADAALIESYGSHTLAGIFGCGAEHLSALRDALSSAGIHTPGARTRAVSIQKVLKGTPVFISCVRDAKFTGFKWISFGVMPDHSPQAQMDPIKYGCTPRPLSITPRTRQLQSAIMPHLTTALQDAPRPPAPASTATPHAARPTSPETRPATRGAVAMGAAALVRQR